MEMQLIKNWDDYGGKRRWFCNRVSSCSSQPPRFEASTLLQGSHKRAKMTNWLSRMSHYLIGDYRGIQPKNFSLGFRVIHFLCHVPQENVFRITVASRFRHICAIWKSNSSRTTCMCLRAEVNLSLLPPLIYKCQHQAPQPCQARGGCAPRSFLASLVFGVLPCC